METTYTVSSGDAVPAGSYNASFEGIEAFEENVEKYGEGVRLRFEIIGGEHDGEIATRICSKKFSPKSNLFKFAKALVGRDLEAGEKFDFADHIGDRGMLIVGETDSGSTRVETFLRSDEEKPKPKERGSRKAGAK